MKVAIIEDETLAARRLEAMIRKLDSTIEIEAVLPSVRASLKYLSSHPPLDLLFMDIHLDDGQSFSIFEQMDISTPIIFTTAYDEYMVKAFRVNSIDYLLKPIDAKELEAALLKFKKLRQPARVNYDEIRAFISSALHQEPEYKTRFMVSQGTKIRTVQIEEIAYFYSEDKVTFLTTKAGQRLPLDFSLDKLMSMLNPKQFFRINRQFIVGLEGIDAIHKYSPSRLKIQLKPDTEKEIFVSIEKYGEFKNWLDG
jgi:DNA-binding LytR/AlgR family response regulator